MRPMVVELRMYDGEGKLNSKMEFASGKLLDAVIRAVSYGYDCARFGDKFWAPREFLVVEAGLPPGEMGQTLWVGRVGDSRVTWDGVRWQVGDVGLEAFVETRLAKLEGAA